MMIGEVDVVRKDFKVNNNRGHDLFCSLYEPQNLDTYPCVVYLHGNSGNRIEAEAAVNHLLPHGIGVFCFDFAGTGNSGGEFLSLGWFEALDLIVVMDHLRKVPKIGKIALWGRSMGAVTSLLYTGMYDTNIAGLVMDSPFSCINSLSVKHIEDKSGLPTFLSQLIFSYLKS